MEHDEVLDRLTREAESFIERAAQEDDPFFLYLPLHAPHTPLAPSERFEGSTGLGDYADLVAQADWTVGRVFDALERAGVGDDTLVIFTSDNGATDKSDIPVPNHGVHDSNSHWRDHKGSVYEGGHRVPLMMRWPAAIEPGASVDAAVSLADMYATLAAIVGGEPGSGAAPDSTSLVPLLSGETFSRGEPLVHHSSNAMLAIREGRWKLILGVGSGVLFDPGSGLPFSEPWQL